MKLLFIGDVVGEIGCLFLQKQLPKLKQKYAIDVTIVNGENSANGNGITAYSAKQIFHAVRISSQQEITLFNGVPTGKFMKMTVLSVLPIMEMLVSEKGTLF